VIDTEFLNVVVTTHEGWFQLLVGSKGDMKEEWFRWPEDRVKILTRATEITDTNVYFSPHLFSEQNSQKQYALPSRTLCVDLDNADITDLRLNPTVMIETSPRRHQGFWVLKNVPENFEELSKKLSYTIENADHSGWPLGHKFRLVGARNFKYNPPPVIHLVHNYTTERIYSEDEILQWVGATSVSVSTADTDDWIESPPTTHVTGPLEVVEKYRANLSVKALSYYSNIQADRSEALWALMSGLFRAGASRDEVYWVALHSVNNKFRDHTHNAERDLAKDVDRANKAETSDKSDVTRVVQLAEKTPGTKNDQKRLVAGIVIQDMNKRGEFIQTEDGRYWFLHSNAGRPVQLGRHSDQLNSILDAMYGLNQSDGFQPFVCHHLVNHTISRGKTAKTAVLSYFDGDTLLLHGNRQDIYRITPESISRHPDGQFGVLFPWRPLSEQEITIDEPIADDWAEWLFDSSSGWFDNLLDFTPEQVKMLVRIWVLFILFRDAAVSRPILALLGQQGSGKSTLFHILYTIFYGKSKSLNAISSIEDFDFLTSSDPFVVFDNVDSWTGWLPDRLALAASSSDLVKRKLYTDSDTVTLKRQAVLGITAHEPKFGRPDVVDRLLIINLARRQKFTPESSMINRVEKARPKIWGAIVKDCQRVLATPDVTPEEVPNFRISDFARLGARIAKALNCYDEFTEVIGKLRKIQTAFSLGEDDILVDGLKRYQSMKNGSSPEYVSAGYLWEYITQFDRMFANAYKTSNALARKLITMEPNLRTMFDISYKYDNSRGIRTWRIDSLDG
jgi:energy-coupling factor transporter ATP-binding protein EcfA2